MGTLPQGTVTFVFSDVEGSTQLLERHGTAMGDALARHHELFEDVVGRHGGAIFETVGDAVYSAFARPGDAIAAALEAQRALGTEDWGPIGRLAVRIAVHTGQVERRGDHYFGAALFRVARLQALGYGEQTLLSGVTARLVADALPEGASLRDLGTHRLKDLGEPEQVLQLIHPELRADFPALKSLDAHPHNLPVQLSSFVGRDAELAELGELLNQQRLVTLLGPGGIGKTRLALQAAAQQVEGFPDGVWFVDLSALHDPEQVPAAIATTLGLREQPGQPISATLAEHLHSKRALLLLDNLEQLLPAAAPSIAELLAAPELRLVVTSRAPLRVRGEREVVVPPLAAGAPDRLEAEPPPAVALFLERARAIKPNLELTSETGPLIAAICQRLDGLPLAIELGAARLRLFSLSQLHDRLTERLPLLTGGARDLPQRQQTLRAAIAWSDELLNEPERRLFARLGVFVGGFSLEAAEAAVEADLRGDLLGALTALIEQSLVRQVDGPAGQPRYTMLETIREYALERAKDLGELEMAYRRHAEYFLALAEIASPLLNTSGKDAIPRLDADYPNLRAALEFAIQLRDQQMALRLVASLWRLWDATYRWTEGLAFLEQALALPGAPLSAAGAEAVQAAGWFSELLLKSEEGRRYAEQSLSLYRELGDMRGVASALERLAPIDDPAAAIALFQESLDIQRELGDVGEASILINLAIAEAARDDLIAAERWATESLAVARARNHYYFTGLALLILGDLRLWQGAPADAHPIFAEATEVLRGDPGMTASALSGSVFVATDLGDLRRARELLSQVMVLIRGADWRENFAYEVLEGAAQVALPTSPLVSATLWGASDANRERTERPKHPVEARYLAERVRTARAAAIEVHFDASYQRGRGLSTDDALAIAETLALPDDP